MTFVDAKNSSQVSSTPVDDGFACQIDFSQAWPRQWDPVLKVWKFYVSGGKTAGADDLPQGVPARSQFLAGSDTAWLTTDEFHHQLESLGSLCLGNAEDDRIVSDKPSPRHRIARGDGTFNEQAWTTAGMHGELWDDLRFWDQQVSDCQWLRLGFGSTETVVDKDGDGFPDSDVRLPIDAKRFKALSSTAAYQAASAWNWELVPVQPTWSKDYRGLSGINFFNMSGKTAAWVSTLGLMQYEDSLNGHSGQMPLGAGDVVPPMHVGLDADLGPWAAVAESGFINRKEMTVSYKQGYDQSGYFGLIIAKGLVGHIDVDLDGAEQGLFNSPGGVGFTITNLKPAAGQAGPTSLPVSVKPTIGGTRGQMPWLTWKAARKDGGTLIFEFKNPERR